MESRAETGWWGRGGRPAHQCNQPRGRLSRKSCAVKGLRPGKGIAMAGSSAQMRIALILGLTAGAGSATINVDDYNWPGPGS